MTTEGERRGGRIPGAVRTARWVLFGLLAVCALLTLFGLPDLQRAVSAGRWPPIALAGPPALLALFICGYAAYRFVLVRAGRYPAGKALVQVGVMLLVLGVVAGIVMRPEPAPSPGPVPVDRALASPDPEVRAIAAEVVRHRPRPDAVRHVDRLIQLLEDPAPQVRAEARATLVTLAGRDAGGQGIDAPERWREYWRRARRAR